VCERLLTAPMDVGASAGAARHRPAIDVISPLDHRYPEALRELDHPPPQLFAIGSVDLLSSPLVSIVGTRDATPYGIRVTQSLTRAFSHAGFGIVSGMARGIDSAAHRAALENGGKTIAVLGTGIDVPYPAGHRELHRAIGASGLVVSESGPGATAHKGSFPKRNRIIAALGRLTIVIEAGYKSGALITANHALELARPVAAVPGPIDSRQSDGSNQLIRDGALVIASIEDALALVGVTTGAQEQPIQLAGDEGKVWAAVGTDPVAVDNLASRLGMPARECLAVLTSLEVAGLIECLITGEVRRR